MDNEALFQEYAVLSRRIKAGDSSAFAEMYQKSARLVYGTCYGILRNEEDASDAMQETYMTCYQKIGELTNDKMFLSWLKKIAASRSLNLYKKNHGDVSYDDTIGAEADVAGDDDLESLPDAMLLKESNREILRSIMKSSLSDVQYQTILLYYYSELPIETIAELMQCPVGTVKTRLKYARIKIKAGVEMYEEKTGDKIKVAIAVPFLARFFEEEASRLTLPPIDPTVLLVKAAETGASAGANAVTGTTASGAGQAAAGVYSGAAPGVTMDAASEAATMGFFSTVAGKAILFVLCFFLLIGGIFAVKSILGGKGDDEYNNRIGKLSRETSGFGTHDSDASEAPSEVESVTNVSTVPQSSVPASTPDASDAQPEDPDVVDFNEPGFVAVDDIPELDQLKKLVHYFVKEYDYENVEDEMVLKGILVGENHPNLPFEVYFPDYSYMNGLTDPKGLMPKDSCSRVNFSYLEWAEENILNISAEDRARINSDENLKVSAPDNFAPSGGYITDDGFVYYTSGDAGDTESNMVFAANYDGEVYTIYTTLYSDFDPSNNPDFDPVEDGQWIRYTMKLKRIDGKLYWTILDCHFMEQHDPSVLEPDYDPAAKLDLPVEVTDQDREIWTASASNIRK
jgi:RNA polymerase sigma-70 factor (ECF subfamily)